MSSQDSHPAGRFLSKACRTAVAGALGLSLVFAGGIPPAGAQEPDTAVATEQPAVPDDAQLPAPSLDPGAPDEPAEPEGTPPAADPAPEAAPDAGQDAIPPLESDEEPPAVTPESEAAPESAPQAKQAPAAVDPSAALPDAQSLMEAPSPTAPPALVAPKAPSAPDTESPGSTPAAPPAVDLPAAPEEPGKPADAADSGTPGAHMGQGLAMEEAAAAANTPMMARAAPLAASEPWIPAGVRGMDVSGWQADSGYTRSTVNWGNEWSMGARFVYVKATEGGAFVDKSRASHLAGATKVGMLHGAYHFALPGAGQATATAQADHFVRNGGGWKADGKTLPPLLDIENNPYGANCYGLSQAAMVNWIKTFSNRVKSKTGRLPMIYTNKGWWVSCTGDSRAFTNQPLHIAAYTGGAPLQIPGGWPTYSMWQFSSTGPFAGDSNVWNGTLTNLRRFASGTTVSRISGKDRYEVSAAASKSAFRPGVKTAYIASGAVYTDALSGSAAAGFTDSPVLLTGTGVLPDVIRAELTRLKPQRIVILGGPATVSDSVMRLLKRYSPSVSRISGKDRYVVSAGVSKSTFKAGTNTAYIASGAIYTDALSGSALAGHQGGPVLLTATMVLPDAIRAELTRLKPKRIVILGGSGSVSGSVMNLLKRYSPSVSRISGADRYEVSASISRSTYWAGTTTVYVASGAVYSDALSGSAVAAHNGSPVLLTAPNVLPNSVKAELQRLKPQRIVILGGTGTVSNGVMRDLQNYAR
ncbi:putative cell wall-binding protein/GH25 family lysozyme M1 (1,4-beta-N-acetylmuramidase) [Arthrobacter stackebrandtii]|uniref:Cell wall-binding protein/GH25 family lysozyme M1 (1,4-beta-N-acetylmuramidase) n=1 Tax=Arthrobacter stackebrandtii TaxID=272161 RepID=A0ABS4Z0K7_9MICC|nr:putative cell wall-binding protein/GH25 family lysozyme M1 (1,4-beta-N-acetylmuramidase) [Arthrobacter stackebrandtii]